MGTPSILRSSDVLQRYRATRTAVYQLTSQAESSDSLMDAGRPVLEVSVAASPWALAALAVHQLALALGHLKSSDSGLTSLVGTSTTTDSRRVISASLLILTFEKRINDMARRDKPRGSSIPHPRGGLKISWHSKVKLALPTTWSLCAAVDVGLITTTFRRGSHNPRHFLPLTLSSRCRMPRAWYDSIFPATPDLLAYPVTSRRHSPDKEAWHAYQRPVRLYAMDRGRIGRGG